MDTQGNPSWMTNQSSPQHSQPLGACVKTSMFTPHLPFLICGGLVSSPSWCPPPLYSNVKN
uniref:Uncharacterized protein n=1 Tax=Otus sunia TaxID=257818 RepID=A0A8C8A6D3_9STRI